MAKPTLTDDLKTYIVQALACFDSPSTVAKAVKAEFGQDVSRQQVEGYDPNKVAGQALGEKWKELFAATRKAFLDDTADIAISHRSVRLRAIQRMAEKAEGQGNMVLAASLMEQAAKEMGNAYTNRREVSGPEGAPIEVAAAKPRDLAKAMALILAKGLKPQEGDGTGD